MNSNLPEISIDSRDNTAFSWDYPYQSNQDELFDYHPAYEDDVYDSTNEAILPNSYDSYQLPSVSLRPAVDRWSNFSLPGFHRNFGGERENTNYLLPLDERIPQNTPTTYRTSYNWKNGVLGGTSSTNLPPLPTLNFSRKESKAETTYMTSYTPPIIHHQRPSRVTNKDYAKPSVKFSDQTTYRELFTPKQLPPCSSRRRHCFLFDTNNDDRQLSDSSALNLPRLAKCVAERIVASGQKPASVRNGHTFYASNNKPSPEFHDSKSWQAVWKWYQTKCSDSDTSLPYVCGSILWLRYSIYIEDLKLVLLQSYAVFMQLFFLLIMTIYRSKKRQLLRVLLSIFMMIFLLFTFLERLPHDRAVHFTGICASSAQIAGSFVCYKAISLKVIDFVSFAPVAFTWVMEFHAIIYSIGIQDSYLLTANTVFFCMDGCLLAMFFIYPTENPALPKHLIMTNITSPSTSATDSEFALEIPTVINATIKIMPENTTFKNAISTASSSESSTVEVEGIMNGCENFVLIAGVIILLTILLCYAIICTIRKKNIVRQQREKKLQQQKQHHLKVSNAVK